MKVLLPFLRTAWAVRSLRIGMLAHDMVPQQQPGPREVGMDRAPAAVPTAITETRPPSRSLASLLPPLASGSQRVVLVRHAETDGHARGLLHGGGSAFDFDLNEVGRQQAAVLAETLVEAFPQMDVVASSHLERSSETADIVAQTYLRRRSHSPSRQESSDSDHTSPPIRMINNKFGEMRLGEFEGLALRGPDHTDADAIRQRMQDFGNLMYQHKRIPWPAGGSSGESIAHVEQRGRAGLDQIWRAVPRGDPVVCVVAHGRFNTILLMALLGLQGRSDAIPQDYTGISVLDVDPEGHWKARVLNYVEHANHVKARNE